MKPVGQKNIAFVGALTPQTLTAESYAFTDSIGMLYDVPRDSSFKLVQRAVNAARKAGADYVIVLAHLGVEPPFTSQELIEHTVGIDAVLDGHSHSVIPEKFERNAKNDSVLVSQMGSKLANVGLLSISPQRKFHLYGGSCCVYRLRGKRNLRFP